MADYRCAVCEEPFDPDDGPCGYDQAVEAYCCQKCFGTYLKATGLKLANIRPAFLEPADPDHTHWLNTARGSYITLCTKQGAEPVVVNDYTRATCPECKAVDRAARETDGGSD